MSQKLTELAIEKKYRARDLRYEVPDGAQRGLYLVVQPSGHQSFCIRYRFHGRPRKLTLKAGVSLADARRLASEAMYAVEKGTDPALAKRAAKEKEAAAAVNTVRYICENFLKREGKKLRTLGQRERALRRLVYPTLGDRLIHEVKRGEINAMLDKIADENGARSADLALQYLRRAFNWYAIQTDDFASPIIKGMGGRYGTIENRRTRVLSDDELRAFWKASDPVSGNPFHGLIRFLLLTGCRRGEAAGLTWDEIDNNGVWHLPATRHKNKTDLSRPLSKAALAIIENQPVIDGSQYVFAVDGKRPLSFSRYKAAFAQRCGIHDWRLHDLRRTCRTLLARSGVDVDTAERCLGHALPNIRATYDKHTYENEMRRAVEKLAALIERITNPPADAVVTPMRRGR
jgi:integrase